ncbi:phage major capsid protein [Amycolatopsis sp. cmx-4-68]|uniref:phage major capsid protein n=1 Tax=Amycolatopsis sp. cmx-4-68 TaxID=2790938 RepID=UPI00397AC50A
MSKTLSEQIEAIDAELEKLDKHDKLTRAQELRRDELMVQSTDLLSRRARELALENLRAGTLATEGGDGAAGMASYRDTVGASFNRNVDPWCTDVPQFGRNAGEVSAAQRGLARAAIDKMQHAPEDGREKIARALDSEAGEPLSKIARWTVCTSDKNYRSAWLKLARDPQNGNREWSPDELRAFQRVQEEARAMSLTDANGGYLVPFQLDPTVIITNNGATNPIRQLARTVVATGDVWNGVTSAGVTTTWYAEAAEAADDSPTLGQPTVNVYKQLSFVPISFEAYQDENNVAEEVAKILRDGSEQADALAFTLGTGSGQPFGIVPALTGGSSVVSQSGTTLDLADFQATQEALPPRWQPNAKWMMHLSSMNRARSIPSGSGLTTPALSEGNPPILLGKGVFENSNMDGTVTGSANDYLAVYGDWSQYVIAERIGTAIELIPNLFGANRRPIGQRGWVMWRRVGADSVVDSAFRMLNKSA